jgi:hypothetical protein
MFGIIISSPALANIFLVISIVFWTVYLQSVIYCRSVNLSFRYAIWVDTVYSHSIKRNLSNRLLSGYMIFFFIIIPIVVYLKELFCLPDFILFIIDSPSWNSNSPSWGSVTFLWFDSTILVPKTICDFYLFLFYCFHTFSVQNSIKNVKC